MEFDFILKFSLSTEEGNAMSDWAKRANEKLLKEEADRKAAEQFYVKQRTQLEAEVPGLWEELKAILYREISAFNKLRPNYMSMDQDYQGAKSINLRSEKMSLTLEFDENALKVETRSRSMNGASVSTGGGYIFEITGNRVGFSNQHERCVSAAVAAESFLNLLV